MTTIIAATFQSVSERRTLCERHQDMLFPSPSGSPSRTMNPTPRIVWMSLVGNSASSFRRSRAMCTSITLSSGVVRAVSFQTSRASVPRDTT